MSASKAVSWDMPIDQVEGSNAVRRQTLPPGFVRKTKDSILDDITEGKPAVMWEGIVYKRRKVLAGWIKRVLAICITVRKRQDGGKSRGGGENVVNISFNYRGNFVDPLPVSMKGDIISIELGLSSGGQEPRSGGGLTITFLAGNGKYMTKDICADGEVESAEIIEAWEDAEIVVREGLEKEAQCREKVEERSRPTIQRQLELLDGIEEKLKVIKATYVEASTVINENVGGDVSEDDCKLNAGVIESAGNFFLLLKSIREHLKTSTKGGTSLSTCYLQRFFDEITAIVNNICDSGSGGSSYIKKPCHRCMLNECFATGIVALHDLLFGMNDGNGGLERNKNIIRMMGGEIMSMDGVSERNRNNSMPGERKEKVLKDFARFS